ncbi:MAG: AgmX/PglI C-terminal domain-containing protein [Proteobacteria bacterium]|jgi:hypothetical protein|nr:AgmX/PglI C-terminal domain-containing protein [Pseudomonadota bacterium]
MTRCLDERELYAAMDGRLSRRRGEHLAICPFCAARLARVIAVRTAARDACAPSPPDWDRVEALVARSVRDATVPRPAAGWSLAPAGLSLAAALLVVLAIVVGRQADEAGPALADAPGGGATTPRIFARAPLAAAVLERFGAGSPGSGAAVAEGDAVECGASGGARLALGDDIAVDEAGPARLEVASLDEWRPTIRLRSGGYRIDVSEGAMPQELVVLAAHAELTVTSGSAEILIVDGVLELRALDGPLRVATGGDFLELAAFEGLRAKAGQGVAVAGAWTRLPASRGPDAGDAPLLDLDRPTGTMPKQAVRDVLRANTDRLRACYETALKRSPGLEALSVTARLRVGVNGRVGRSSVAGVEEWPDLKRCLSEVLEGMRFPPPSGGEVELVAPLRLTPLD